jgi:hypothetical protein
MATIPMVCTPKMLFREHWVPAARTAAKINPLNHAPIERLGMVIPGFDPSPERLAILTLKYWGAQGVQLTVGFLDNPPADLRARILSHMNAWSKTANIKFVETTTDPQVRIAREPRPGVGWRLLVLPGNGHSPHPCRSANHDAGRIHDGK